MRICWICWIHEKGWIFGSSGLKSNPRVRFRESTKSTKSDLSITIQIEPLKIRICAAHFVGIKDSRNKFTLCRTSYTIPITFSILYPFRQSKDKWNLSEQFCNPIRIQKCLICLTYLTRLTCLTCLTCLTNLSFFPLRPSRNAWNLPERFCNPIRITKCLTCLVFHVFLVFLILLV